MAIPASLITNLSLGGIGLVSAGGLAYGGYELLKDRPRAMSEFLNTKNKIPLSQEPNQDEKEWKANWEKYVNKYSPKPKKPAPKPKPAKGAQENPPQEDEVAPAEEPEINDIWGLATQVKTSPKDVPIKFKEKCKTEAGREISGTWNKDFAPYLEYCTKENPEAD